MLETIFKALLLTSLIGTVLAAVLMLLRPLTKKYFSAGWHYYMWLVVLVVMVLPVKFSLPEGMQFLQSAEAASGNQEAVFADEQHIHKVVWWYIEDAELTAEAGGLQQTNGSVAVFVNFVESKINTIAFVWLFIAVILLFVKIMGYIMFRFKIMRNSDTFLCPVIKRFTKRNVIVRRSTHVHSPIMMGILRPVLVLPDVELTEEQLDNVLAHEMTHFRRHDIACKWFVALVKCIHWFNPMVYVTAKQTNLWCEISCDLAVVERMNKEEKRSYIDTILALISTGKSKNIPLTTGMLGSKEVLKRRFLMIKNKNGISKRAKLVSGVVAAALLVGTLGVSGVMANDILDTETTEAAKGSYVEAEVKNETVSETTAAADVVYEADNAEDVQVELSMNEEAKEYSGEVSYTYTDGTMTIDTASDKTGVKEAEPEVIWPCPSSDKITAAFVTRVHPVTGETSSHNGIDIGVKTGTDVVAAIGGKVTLAGWDRSYGYSVVISDGNMAVRYAHLSDILVEKGDTVTAGQLVAKSGNTGNSTGPHLHFELSIDGENVDPSLYMK